MNKEFLYVGHYYDIKNRYILKIGTTNDIKRRTAEHTRKYRESANYRLPCDREFHMDFILPLSKYNTLRYEDKNRSRWKEENIGDFVRNDRFCCAVKPESVTIVIRKTYTINL